jgi:endonuclease YncB( thermonuclease family)
LFQTEPEPTGTEDAPASPQVETGPSDAGPVAAAAPEVRPAGQPVPRDWLIIGETAPAPRWYDDDVEPDPEASRTGIGKRLGLAGAALATRWRRAPDDGAHGLEDPGTEPISEPPRRFTRGTALVAGSVVLALLLMAAVIYAALVRPLGAPTAGPTQVADAPVGQAPAPDPAPAASSPGQSGAVPLQSALPEAPDENKAVASAGEAPPGGASSAAPAVTDGRSTTEATANTAPATGPDSSGTGAVPLGPSPTAPSPDSVPRTPLRGVPEVLDTATLWLSGQIVHLYGVEWVRGAGDPDDFTRYLKGREVACDPVDKVDAYRCTVDGHDLSEVVLFNGGAKSTPSAPPELRAAEEKARIAKIGVWSR